MKVGFFGGCFNPPSNIHINLAKELVESKILDKVIYVPVGNYYKKQSLAQAEHRYNMLKLACKSYNYLEVEDIAVKSKKNLYAVDTFKLIYDKYANKNIEIYLIMGSDNFEKIDKWKEYNKIIKEYNYIVLQRPNHEIDIKMKNVICYNLKQPEEFSSTRIRHLIEGGKEFLNYVDEDVYKYIQKNKLYN